MRVALVSAYYPTHGGGMELACAELARVLRDAHIEVTWIAQRDSMPPDGADALYVPVSGTDLIYKLSGVPMPLPMPWAARTISREAVRADLVIVVEANFMLSVMAFWIARMRSKKILLIQHVGKPSTLSRLARAVMTLGEWAMVRPMVRCADAVVCVSPVVAKHFSKLRHSETLLTIGHGIDTALFRPPLSAVERQRDRAALGLPEARSTGCYLGRLTDSKGLEVVRELALTRTDWHFAIAGSGPIDPGAWGLPNVTFLGQLDRGDAATLLRASDALILPSQSESFSLVVREALACDCKVVCSAQILDTDPGLEPFLTTRPVDLARPGETAAGFAQALDFMPDFSLAGARDYVERVCSTAASAAQYLRIVERLASAQPVGRS